MQVPGQRVETAEEVPPKGAAARTRALMVATASAMMRQGLSPSVSDVAEVAGVSRSTAYRYFPTRGDMLRAVVAEALGPILDRPATGGDAAARLESLYRAAYPRLFEHEATFRAALRQSMEPDEAGRQDGSLGRGHRRKLLAAAVEGLGLSPDAQSRLVMALSLTFGTEAMVVLKDIWGLDLAAAQEVALDAAQAILAAAQQRALGAENPKG